MNKNTPTVKGVRTGAQAAGGALLGLIAVVWAVPGVPEAVQAYLLSNALPVLLGVAVPAGLLSWLQNKAGK